MLYRARVYNFTIWIMGDDSLLLIHGFKKQVPVDLAVFKIWLLATAYK